MMWRVHQGAGPAFWISPPGLHFAAYALILLHHAKQIATQDLPDIVIPVALAHQSFGDLRQLVQSSIPSGISAPSKSEPSPT